MQKRQQSKARSSDNKKTTVTRVRTRTIGAHERQRRDKSRQNNLRRNGRRPPREKGPINWSRVVGRRGGQQQRTRQHKQQPVHQQNNQQHEQLGVTMAQATIEGLSASIGEDIMAVGPQIHVTQDLIDVVQRQDSLILGGQIKATSITKMVHDIKEHKRAMRRRLREQQQQKSTTAPPSRREIIKNVMFGIGRLVAATGLNVAVSMSLEAVGLPPELSGLLTPIVTGAVTTITSDTMKRLGILDGKPFTRKELMNELAVGAAAAGTAGGVRILTNATLGAAAGAVLPELSIITGTVTGLSAMTGGVAAQFVQPYLRTKITGKAPALRTRKQRQLSSEQALALRRQQLRQHRQNILQRNEEETLEIFKQRRDTARMKMMSYALSSALLIAYSRASTSADTGLLQITTRWLGGGNVADRVAAELATTFNQAILSHTMAQAANQTKTVWDTLGVPHPDAPGVGNMTRDAHDSWCYQQAFRLRQRIYANQLLNELHLDESTKQKWGYKSAKVLGGIVWKAGATATTHGLLTGDWNRVTQLSQSLKDDMAKIQASATHAVNNGVTTMGEFMDHMQQHAEPEVTPESLMTQDDIDNAMRHEWEQSDYGQKQRFQQDMEQRIAAQEQLRLEQTAEMETIAADVVKEIIAQKAVLTQKQVHALQVDVLTEYLKTQKKVVVDPSVVANEMLDQSTYNTYVAGQLSGALNKLGQSAVQDAITRERMADTHDVDVEKIDVNDIDSYRDSYTHQIIDNYIPDLYIPSVVSMAAGSVLGLVAGGSTVTTSVTTSSVEQVLTGTSTTWTRDMTGRLVSDKIDIFKDVVVETTTTVSEFVGMSAADIAVAGAQAVGANNIVNGVIDAGIDAAQAATAESADLGRQLNLGGMTNSQFIQRGQELGINRGTLNLLLEAVGGDAGGEQIGHILQQRLATQGAAAGATNLQQLSTQLEQSAQAPMSPEDFKFFSQLADVTVGSAGVTANKSVLEAAANYDAFTDELRANKSAFELASGALDTWQGLFGTKARRLLHGTFGSSIVGREDVALDFAIGRTAGRALNE